MSKVNNAVSNDPKQIDVGQPPRRSPMSTMAAAGAISAIRLPVSEF